MARELVPKEQVRLPRGLFCPTCDRKTKFEPVTGVEAHPLLGRIVVARCKVCSHQGLVEA